MNNGFVVHFEDNPNLSGAIKAGLELFSNGRHRVVAGAADLAGSLAVLDQIASGELEANTVMFDANLSSETSSGDDARVIRDRIEELRLSVRTIGISAHSMTALGIQVDADIPKREFKAIKLVEVLDGLEDPSAEK